MEVAMNLADSGLLGGLTGAGARVTLLGVVISALLLAGCAPMQRASA
jgi:hypothetical protein